MKFNGIQEQTFAKTFSWKLVFNVLISTLQKCKKNISHVNKIRKDVQGIFFRIFTTAQVVLLVYQVKSLSIESLSIKDGGPSLTETKSSQCCITAAKDRYLA